MCTVVINGHRPLVHTVGCSLYLQVIEEQRAFLISFFRNTLVGLWMRSEFAEKLQCIKCSHFIILQKEMTSTALLFYQVYYFYIFANLFIYVFIFSSTLIWQQLLSKWPSQCSAEQFTYFWVYLAITITFLLDFLYI